MPLTKVQSTGITDSAVTTAKINADAVTDAKIADNAVVTAAINADAVTSAKIADNAVVTAAINADAVTGAKIADDAINSEHFTDGSIDTAHIGDNQVTSAKATGIGGLVFVGQASSSSEVSDLTLDNVFTSTYTNYLIVGEYTLINGSGPACRFRFRSGGSSGSDLSGSEYNYHWIRYNADSNSTNNLKNTADAACDFSAPVNNDSARVSFRLCLTVYDPYDSSTRTALSGTGRMTATDAHSAFMTGSCDYKGTGTAVTGIKFYANSDNVKNGHFRVYGIVDS